MNRQTVKALYKKEILDILRDKKTLLMMIVVPLILYPLIFLGSFALASKVATQSTTESYSIAFGNDCEELKDYIVDNQKEREYSFIVINYLDNDISDERRDDILDNNLFDNLDVDEEKLTSMLSDGEIDAYVTHRVENNKDYYRITFYSSETKSATAYDMLKNMIADYKVYYSENKIEAAGLDVGDILYSIDYEENDIATNEETVGSLIGSIIPFLLISSVLLGAMYPAIDTTAGEKERGTLETMLTLPVKNIELILSKFLATSTVATGAAFLNVLSMGILGAYFYETIFAVNSSDFTFSLSVYAPAVALVLLLSVVFAMLSSAVCLLICIYAKSFKEAQNYSTPVILVFMFAGMAGIIPGVELNATTSLIPVVNIALLISQLFSLEYNAGYILQVLLSNLAYSLLAVVIMAKVFSSENILFGDATEGIHFIEKRSDMKDKQMPGIGDIILLFSLLLVIVLFGGSLFVLKCGIWGLVIEQALIIGMTLFYCWYIKCDFKKLFSLKFPKIKHLIGGILLWAGVYILMLYLSWLLSLLFPGSAESADSTLDSIWEGKSLFIVLFTSALIPAICEEFAFRGFLFGTLKNKYKPLTAILWTGAIFGLYHMNLVKALVVGFLGCVLAYAVKKSGSIIVSILMHFLNNGIAIWISFNQDILFSKMPWLFGAEISAGFIAVSVLISIVFCTLGVLMLKGKKAVNIIDA